MASADDVPLRVVAPGMTALVAALRLVGVAARPKGAESLAKPLVESRCQTP